MRQKAYLLLTILYINNTKAAQISTNNHLQLPALSTPLIHFQPMNKKIGPQKTANPDELQSIINYKQSSSQNIQHVNNVLQQPTNSQLPIKHKRNAIVNELNTNKKH